MKKLVLSLIALFAFCSISFAEDLNVSELLSKIPSIKTGVAFSIADSAFNYTSLVEVAKYKFVSLDVGYAGRAKNTGDKVIGAVSFDLLSLDKYVSWPIAKYVEFKPFAYFGAGRLNFGQTGNETDYGVGATIINISF